MRWKRSRILAAVAILALLWAGSLAWDYFNPDSIPHVSMSDQLKLFASAIYEFRETTGRWPATLSDLEKTSLPAKNPYWKQSAVPLEILWPKDLKPDPKDNSSVLLIYFTGGLFNRLGRVWVCWGDLRTEHLPEADLRAVLAKQKSPY